MEKQNYAIARLGKVGLKTVEVTKRNKKTKQNEKVSRGGIGAVSAHVFRHENKFDVHNSDPERRQLNQTLYGSSAFVETVEAYAEEHNKLLKDEGKRAMRSDAVVMIDGFLSYSPEAELDVDAWMKDSLGFLKKEYGDQLLYAVSHLDETTPHIQFGVKPFIDGRLDAKAWLDKDRLTGLQDRYAEAVEHHGLSRGERHSSASHESIKEFYAGIKNAEAAAKKENLSFSDEALAILKKNAPEMTKSQAVNAGINLMRGSLGAANARIQQLQKENRNLKQTATELKAETHMLRNTSVYHVLEAYGASRDPNDKTKFQTLSGTISVKKSDPLVWSDFGNDRSGTGAIDLVMHLEDCSFAEARGWLLENVPEDRLGSHGDLLLHDSIQPMREPPKPFKMPSAASGNEKTMHYLCDKRMLDASIVHKAIQGGFLYETENKGYRNAVFCYKTNNKVCGAEIRVNHDGGDCLKRWKESNSKSGVFLTGNTEMPTKLAICESPIDAMSYVELHPGAAAIACGGTQGIEAIGVFRFANRDLLQDVEIVAASDNDNEGRLFAKKLVNEGIATKHDMPTLKDWNADLIAKKTKPDPAPEAPADRKEPDKQKFRKVSIADQIAMRGSAAPVSNAPRPSPRPK